MLVIHVNVTIDPTQRERFVVAMEQMVTGTRSEPGNLGYYLLADVRRPEAFTIVEQWSSEEALIRHFGQPHVRQFAALADRFSFAADGTTFEVVGSESIASMMRRLVRKPTASERSQQHLNEAGSGSHE